MMKVLAASIAVVAALSTAALAENSLSVGKIGVFQRGGYDDQRDCGFYRLNDLPAPKRCYRHFHDYYGHAAYIDGDFVFKSEVDFDGWKDRDDFRRWKNHDFDGR